jgi:hypothetical protein
MSKHMEPHGACMLLKGFQIVTREGGGGETWFGTIQNKKKTFFNSWIPIP